MTEMGNIFDLENRLNNSINFLRALKNCAMVTENKETTIDVETLKMLYQLMKDCKQKIVT